MVYSLLSATAINVARPCNVFLTQDKAPIYHSRATLDRLRYAHVVHPVLLISSSYSRRSHITFHSHSLLLQTSTPFFPPDFNMSAATQSIRSSPLPSILRYDPIASSSTDSLRHITPREQPLQPGRPEPGTLRNAGHDAWNDERNRLLVGHRVCYRCKWRIEIVGTSYSSCLHLIS